MTIIEKIKAEIENALHILGPGYSEMEMGKISAYGHILSFLSTLESEKPMNPDDAMKELNEKIALVKQRGTWDGVDVDKYMDEVRGREPEKPSEGLDVTDFCKPIDPGIAQCIADHSWEMLGEDEKPVPNDLEEAVNAYSEEHEYECFDAENEGRCHFVANAFIAGAKWDRSQMMKGAVDAKFISMDEGIIKYSPLFTRKLKQIFRLCDKVRIIIVNED